MAADDVQKLREIADEKRRRLRQLEKQQARMGFSTPAETLVEIEQLRREIQPYEDAISHPVSIEAAEDLGPGGRWLATDRKLDLMWKFMSERMDRMEEHAAERYEKQELDRREGQRFYRTALGVVALGVLISLILIALLIGGKFLS